MPLQRRVPKFGFKNINRLEYTGVNLDVLQALVEKDNAQTIDFAYLKAHGLVSKNDRVKILGRGELTSSVEVHAHAFSKTAIASIEKAGGKTITL
jgi:large subunit ribosomal protein L15